MPKDTIQTVLLIAFGVILAVLICLKVLYSPDKKKKEKDE
jgi:hypothetical protein